MKIGRFLEIGLVAAALLILSPVFLLVFFLIRFSSPGPALFKQKRVGLGGAEFTFYKFRTMLINNQGLLLTAHNDQRITPLGKLLRKTKIDELPQLWNVLWGDMTLVGPRPEVPLYVDLDNSLWVEVLKVKPGITDPITLQLRNEERLIANIAYDKEVFYREVLQPFKLMGYIEYSKTRTWKSDICVLLQTLLVVVVPQTDSQLTDELDKKLIYSAKF